MDDIIVNILENSLFRQRIDYNQNRFSKPMPFQTIKPSHLPHLNYLKNPNTFYSQSLNLKNIQKQVLGVIYYLNIEDGAKFYKLMPSSRNTRPFVCNLGDGVW